MNFDIITITGSSMTDIMIEFRDKINGLLDSFGVNYTITGDNPDSDMGGTDGGCEYYSETFGYLFRIGQYKYGSPTSAILMARSNSAASTNINTCAYKGMRVDTVSGASVYTFEFGIYRDSNTLRVDFFQGIGTRVGISMYFEFIKSKGSMYFVRACGRSSASSNTVVGQFVSPTISTLPTPSSSAEIVICNCVDAYGSIVEGLLAYKGTTSFIIGDNLIINGNKYIVYSSTLLLEI